MAREQLNECKTRHLQGEARLVTLKQLQDKTQSKSKLYDWLEKHELTGFNPLWQSVHTDPEWETALEAVLSERIRAIELSSLDWAKSFSKEILPARICFFSAQGSGTETDNEKVSGMDSLVDLVYCDKSSFRDILENWLCHVYVADNLEQALQRRETLRKVPVLLYRMGILSTGRVSGYSLLNRRRTAFFPGNRRSKGSNVYRRNEKRIVSGDGTVQIGRNRAG